MRYVIKWHQRSDSSISGEIDVTLNFVDASALKRRLDEKYPEFKHTVIEIE